MRLIEGKAAVSKRRTLSGLIQMCEAGELRMEQLTDRELEWIIAGTPGEAVNLRHLSDDELATIINGGDYERL